MEPELTNEKVKTISTCVKCKKELEKISLGADSTPFLFGSIGLAAFYCKNKECDMYGYLTLGHRPVVDVEAKK